MNIRVRSKQGIMLLIVLLVTLAFTGCSKDEAIKVGIEKNNRPFTYTEGEEKKGFEVELWQAIAKKAKLKYEWVAMEYGELNKSVKSGDVDLAIAGMTVTNARKNKLDYSDPYFQSGEAILTASDNEGIKGKDDLAKKVVATRNGSTAYHVASEIQGIKIRSYANISDAYDDLKNKNVDAVVFEEHSIQDYVQNSAEGKAKKVGEVFNKDSYAIVAKKRNMYMGKINKAIIAVSKDGTYEALYTKWFGSKPEKMPKELKHDMEKDIEHES
ncbi:transporter substrate-binding domain-containing protein [Paenibacillus sp. Soil724D2]|uniref:transporter substrate-binding domain-containing protein n=1 Tax=Paenibacillus sp. (strain Soil724D2) TaxID=1736392 RepID=UPI000715EAE6|nr:transporter substrate-binding domain-containing protein [Paenibacillus sp. Soil724D2]KRE52287.1 glutamine ABC transporter substrate-bindnig protein [Paenibacillus sp. Soil724D2]